MRPLRGIDRHDVGVAEDQDRALLPVALDARDDVGARRILREHLVGNAFLLEDLLQVVDRFGFVARRAAGVDPQQRLEMLKRFGLERGAGRLLRVLSLNARQDRAPRAQISRGMAVEIHGSRRISNAC